MTTANQQPTQQKWYVVTVEMGNPPGTVVREQIMTTMDYGRAKEMAESPNLKSGKPQLHVEMRDAE